MRRCFLVLFLLVAYCWGLQSSTFIPAIHSDINWTGRILKYPTGAVAFDWSGVQFSFSITGTSSVSMEIEGSNNFYNIFLNGNLTNIINSSQNSTLVLSTNLDPSTSYSFLVTKRTEAQNSNTAEIVRGLMVDGGATLIRSVPDLSPRRLEFLGDSITCGYGIMANENTLSACSGAQGILENNWKTYGEILARGFGAQVHIESWSGKGLVKNYGDTPPSANPFPVYFNRTFGVTSEPIYNFSEFLPDAVIINLGTNDYSLPPVPSAAMFMEGYRNYLNQIRSAYDNEMTFFLVCGPMTSANPSCPFVQEVVNLEQNTYYINMENILSDEDLGCGGHPNVSGHQKMANAASPIISTVLDWQFTQSNAA